MKRIQRSPSFSMISSAPSETAHINTISARADPGPSHSTSSSTNVPLIAGLSVVCKAPSDSIPIQAEHILTLSQVSVAILAFLAYVAYRIGRGDKLATIFTLPRKTRPESVIKLLPEEEAGPAAFIIRHQRFSVRSSVYAASHKGSVRSNSSRRPALTRTATGQVLTTNSPYQQYSNAYLVRPTGPTRPAVTRSRTAPTLAPIRTKDLPTEATPSRPEMVHISDKTSIITSLSSPASHGVAQQISLSKPDTRRLTITTRSLSHDSTKSLKVQPGNETWSWTKPQTPPTTRYELDANPAPPTDPIGPRMLRVPSFPSLTMEPIDEDAVATPIAARYAPSSLRHELPSTSSAAAAAAAAAAAQPRSPVSPASSVSRISSIRLSLIHI